MSAKSLIMWRHSDQMCLWPFGKIPSVVAFCNWVSVSLIPVTTGISTIQQMSQRYGSPDTQALNPDFVSRRVIYFINEACSNPFRRGRKAVGIVFVRISEGVGLFYSHNHTYV